MAHRTADVVDDAEAGTRDDRRIGHVVGESLGELLALPRAVQPVGVAAVAATHVDRHGQLGLHVEADRGAVQRGRLDGGAGGDAGTGDVVDLHARPAELLDAAVLPDAAAVVERAEAVGGLLDDHHERELFERERYVQPPHALERRICRPARRLGLTDRADAPRPVTRTDPGVWADRDVFAVDGEGAAPGTQLGEALRIQRDAVALPHDVRLLLHDVEQTVPREVGGDTLGLVEHDAYLVQRVGDLDAVADDVLVQPVLVDGVGQVDCGLRVATADQEVGVLDAQVGVVAHAGDDEDVAGAVVRVEVAAVVEIPVAGPGPGDRLRDLVNRVFVHGAEHYAVPSRSFSSRDLW
ncbi:DUF1589 domain-containing protein [Mycobacterium sp. ST-F2]|uniref:DUF1589 domain-containing protein n=1 Tax=Mycobacterium sp. ST-F2 TaxID=1490484 RepID=UPI00143C84F2